MIDLHAHVLPGLDDGPPDLEAAVELCRAAAADGTTTLVAAGHWREGYFRVESATLAAAAAELRSALAGAGVALEIAVASCVHWDPRAVKLLRGGTLATLPGGRYFLLELPDYFSSSSLEEYIFEAQLAGFITVIVHPERNGSLRGDLELLAKLAGLGAVLQWTAGAFTGRLGSEAREAAVAALAEGLVHLVSSDAHDSSKRPPGLRGARRVIEAEDAGVRGAQRIFEDNPRAVLSGEDLPAGESARGGTVGFDLGI